MWLNISSIFVKVSWRSDSENVIHSMCLKLFGTNCHKTAELNWEFRWLNAANKCVFYAKNVERFEAEAAGFSNIIRD